MPGLNRIILIDTHLPNVVELKLDGHTNVCGTNASGKTTLQRLIPVFYGELPSRVVPRTRKKFSEFYLPHANSYLVYEYQREEGDMCQVVISRKDADSVQYRFVSSEFTPEQLLVEVDGQAKAMLEPQWLQQLKQLGIEYSNKIYATSEYRSIIQNDATVGRANSRENVALRRWAAHYALVAPKKRIRHVEKLVSAVHAKEGKMDTLRTMLAAIFEEDGLVQPATTVRNTKARDWITQMRQAKRLQSLHQDFNQITALAQQLQQLEAQLQQIKPVLEADLQTQKTARADQQQQRQLALTQLDDCKTQFEQQEFALNGQISEAEQQLNTVSSRLDSIQSKYDHYLDSDIDQLEKDMRSLPLWREQLEEQREHYHLLIEQHQDLEAKLLQQKHKLADSLDRLRQKNDKQAKQIQDTRNQIVLGQQQKEAQLRSQYEQRRDVLIEEFEKQLESLTEQSVTLQFAAKNPQLSESETENLALADKRVQLAQRQWQQTSQHKTEAEKAFNQARIARDAADEQLTEKRRAVRLAKEKLDELKKQLNPEQGSLRQFLRDNVNGWEEQVGKVIHAPLLDRKDLMPRLTDTPTGLLGVTLDLAAIDSPDYALDEQALKHTQEQYISQLEQYEEAQYEAEALLQERYESAEQIRETLNQRSIAFDQAEKEVNYANEAKQRVLDDQKQQIAKRKEIALKKLQVFNEQKAEQQIQKNQGLSQLKSDFEEQLLEFRSGWQDELTILDEQIAELEQQVAQRRAQNKEHIKQLEDAFNAELASKDIDTDKLATLKSSIDKLNRDIQSVTGRRDELKTYQTFIEIDWSKLRPQLLEQETSLKSNLQQQRQQKHNIRQQYQQDKAEFKQQISQLEQGIHHCGSFITEIEPLVKSLGMLSLQFTEAGDGVVQFGDQQERISRCNESLATRSNIEKQLKELLLQFENNLGKDAGKDFLDTMQQEFDRLDEHANSQERLPILQKLLSILESKTKQIIEQGETIGGDLANFFKVFSDINRKIANQSKRLSDEVADDLKLDGIARSEVKILSTVDELNFWAPLKHFASRWHEWRHSGEEMPGDDYLNSLADVVEVLPNNASYNIESLLRLELHLNESGSDLVIKNDRQLLESSSHGMAYLILCKYLLAFTRLLRNDANITIHWPIDEIGTLAYHNVEKLFNACDSNAIGILGAFPNPESDVLMLFKHRYLIDKQKQELQKIEPKINRISQRLQASKLQEAKV